jgi:hypothetical protein
MVDYMLWPWFERLPLLVDAGFTLNADGKTPKLAAWVKTMEANDVVKKIKVPTELQKKFMEGYRNGKPLF